MKCEQYDNIIKHLVAEVRSNINRTEVQHIQTQTVRYTLHVLGTDSCQNWTKVVLSIEMYNY